MKTIVVMLLMLIATCCEGADLFTSAATVERLFELETSFVPQVEKFITTQEATLAKLRTLLQDMKSQATFSYDDLTAQKGYDVIYRLVKAKELVGQLLEINESEILNWMSAEDHSAFPDETDLKGARTAIVRLQRTYEKMPRKLLPMASAGKLFEMGVEAYEQKDWFSAQEWFSASEREMNKTSTGDPSSPYSQPVPSELYDYLSFVYYKLGNLKSAMHYSVLYLQIDPNSARIANNLAHLRALLEKSDIGEVTLHSISRNYNSDNILHHSSQEMYNYRRLCQGKSFPPPEKVHNLKCYFIKNHPLLYLKPAQVEPLWNGVQQIRLFRNIVTEAEGLHVLNIAKPLIRRSTAYNGSDLQTAEFRISENTWLSNDHDAVIEAINRRIEAVTGLDIETAESLQVCNYGIGGHYEPHMDWGRMTNGRNQEDGNRIATLMIYFTDVSEGGRTVFPDLGVGVPPSKNDAIFWFNLEVDGEGDALTLHGACPVLHGAKWVGNKWFHQRGSHRSMCSKTEPSYYTLP